jgi:hypothetical protein
VETCNKVYGCWRNPLFEPIKGAADVTKWSSVWVLEHVQESLDDAA